MSKFRRAAATAAAVGSAAAMTLTGVAGRSVPALAAAPAVTSTPIKHVVVIFQENVSFDHYFGTYPKATNTGGQPFAAAAGTPAVNGLLPTGPGVPAAMAHTSDLTTDNPNKDAKGKQINPRRYDPTNINDVLTCDQDHDYGHEQQAFDNGAMDKFVTTVGTGTGKSNTGQACNAADVMNYYDGNTVTGVWNYAQHFAMSDNSYGTGFGPSSPGAINLISGNTGGIDKFINGADTNGETVPDGKGGASMVGDPQPYYDDCSVRDAVSMGGKNVGDLLNGAGVSWGFFEGGFKPTTSFADAAPGQPTSRFTPNEFKAKFAQKPAADEGICNAYHPVGVALGGTGTNATAYKYKNDYIPHHQPFQYYASTANPHHLAPASLGAIGTDTQTTTNGTPQFDTANHQYDMSDWDTLVGAVTAGTLPGSAIPGVSYLKASGYQDGHPGYSDPIDEQQFVVREINALQKTPEWNSTAVVVAYDDSDGWYDHAYSGIHNTSDTSGVAGPIGPQDFLTGVGLCGDPKAQPPLAGENGRCGYGPRLPLLVISPYARANFVDHTLTDQSSILRFIEDNWKLGRIAGSTDAMAGPLDNLFDFAGGPKNTPLFLNPNNGSLGSPTSDGIGYVTVTDRGAATGFGDAPSVGSAPAGLAAPIVNVSGTPDHRGYRMVAADGGVFSFGNAAFFGSTGNIKLNQPVVGLAPTPTLRGYWLVAEDGGVFSFGDAQFFGSTGNIKLNQPIVGITATPTGKGYRLVAADGGIFAFGDASYNGSTGNIKLNQPIVDMVATPSGKGYDLIATDGGVFSFGDAQYKGSTGSIKLAQPIIGAAITPSGNGYYLVATDGGVFNFGDASFKGSNGAKPAGANTVGIVD
ncbi:MAG: hypothetical protein NVS3B21_18340 [Acidimicrobiales bacterium]